MTDEKESPPEPPAEPEDDHTPPIPSATAALYERLGITDEEVSDVVETDSGELEIDVSYFALERQVLVDATIRLSRRPHRSTIVRLSFTTADVWRTILTGEQVEEFPRPTILAAHNAFVRDADEESEFDTDVLAALGSPGSASSVRAYPDASLIDLSAKVAALMAKPDSDFPPRPGPNKERSLGPVGRLVADEEMTQARRRAKTRGRTSSTTWRRLLDEAARRGFIDRSTGRLTAAGQNAVDEKALWDREQKASRERAPEDT